MLSPSVDIPWAIAAIMVMFIILAIGVLMAIIIHSRKIAESERKFRHLFDRVFDSLILVDEAGRIISANNAASNLTGYTNQEICQLTIDKLIRRVGMSKLDGEILLSLKNNRDFFGEGVLVNKAGQIIESEAGCTRIEIQGKPFALCSFRDITYRKKIESDLRAKNITLREILDNIEKEKIEFRSQIADDINEVIIPAVRKIVNPNGTINLVYYEMVLSNLNDIAAKSGGPTIAFSNLTPREAEICNMLKSGATSKDIADALKISLPTVNKHREHIRKKLVISNKNVNLAIFLKDPNQRIADKKVSGDFGESVN